MSAAQRSLKVAPPSSTPRQPFGTSCKPPVALRATPKKSKTTENAPYLQDTGKSIKESKGITSQFGGPVSWRKVLKELNANHPDPSPAAKQARSP